VAFGDSFIWADATSGETASRAAKRAVEQTRSARIDESSRNRIGAPP
jgi:hypothetical protein